MTEDDIRVALEAIRADPEITAFLAAAPKRRTAEQTARVARLLFGA